jgi:hypothetical protein
MAWRRLAGAMTARYAENICETVETMTRTVQQSTRDVTNYVVQAQELNTRFAGAPSRPGSTRPVGRPS